ncbi:MAG: ABC transporter permease [Acidimicrobiaceae bacterium]|nr:ABC transporter permease [Acidimicrobiaceae bacterium]
MAYRELIFNLTARDVKLKYKRSSLGVAWSLLYPLFMMAIYTAIFNVFLRAVNTPNYWALVLGGLVVWFFFSSAIGSATTSFVNGSNLISKIYFPVETLPIASVLANFVNLLISLAILVPVLAIMRLPLGSSLLLLPVALLALLAFSMGLAMIVASLTVYFRDLEHLIGLGLTALFYLSPVLYPLNPQAIPKGGVKYLPILELNPMSWFLDTFHRLLYYGTWPDPTRFILMLAASALALIMGYVLLQRMRGRLAEEL